MEHNGKGDASPPRGPLSGRGAFPDCAEGLVDAARRDMLNAGIPEPAATAISVALAASLVRGRVAMEVAEADLATKMSEAFGNTDWTGVPMPGLAAARIALAWACMLAAVPKDTLDALLIPAAAAPDAWGDYVADRTSRMVLLGVAGRHGEALEAWDTLPSKQREFEARHLSHLNPDDVRATAFELLGWYRLCVTAESHLRGRLPMPEVGETGELELARRAMLRGNEAAATAIGLLRDAEERVGAALAPVAGPRGAPGRS